jgi:hypothetical protein
MALEAMVAAAVIESGNSVLIYDPERELRVVRPNG